MNHSCTWRPGAAGAARVGGGGACRPGLQGRWLGAYLSGQIRDQLL
jgi:hypothetical protein